MVKRIDLSHNSILFYSNSRLREVYPDVTAVSCHYIWRYKCSFAICHILIFIPAYVILVNEIVVNQELLDLSMITID
jgi:hypothetical protein